MIRRNDRASIVDVVARRGGTRAVHGGGAVVLVKDQIEPPRAPDADPGPKTLESSRRACHRDAVRAREAGHEKRISESRVEAPDLILVQLRRTERARARKRDERGSTSLAISSVERYTVLSLSLSLFRCQVIERARENRGLDKSRFRKSIHRLRDLPLEHFLSFLSRSHLRLSPQITVATTKRNTSSHLAVLLPRSVYLSLTRIHAHVHARAARDRGSMRSGLVEAFGGIVTCTMHTALGNSSGATAIHHMIDPSRIRENPLKIARDVPGFPSKLSKLETTSPTESRFRCPPDAVTQRFYKHP